MSGTGQFRNARGARQPGRAGTPSGIPEEHLGDRLAAFVDGELGGDARDRVVAHLATCDRCRCAADEQRRLKSAVADAIPPALSAGLLARLQGLPGGDPGAGPSGPGGPPGARGRGVFGGSVLGGGPGGEADSCLAPTGERLSGFPIHDFGRPSPAFGRSGQDFGRPAHDFARPGGSASRGRRFAFAAAGAFSLAALALGGALPLDAVVEGGGPADPAAGTATTPLSTTSIAHHGTIRPGVTSVSVDSRQLFAPQGGQVPAGGSSPNATDLSGAALSASTPTVVPPSAPEPSATWPSATSQAPTAPSPTPLTGVAPERPPLAGSPRHAAH
ncbi:zf-HC2 domain-containing protein [Streptantibioticus parmotrematis]|uniref:zf-HC2 domain-containing protein n=1 Tax=Streptantibioticus parmotrematis TaxID=2873249 RepID=UPI0027DFE62E|nr:zf-HC2 domain-containing protein [Streptantibioticus parmotrematis]